MTLDFSAMALSKGHYENPLAIMLLIGVFAVIAALRIVQGGITVGGGTHFRCGLNKYCYSRSR
jgi:hypothetical protein